MSRSRVPGGGAARGALRRVRALAVDSAGGPARARAALTLAAVLAVNGADTGTISATASNLEHAFGIGNTQIGLLLTVVALTGRSSLSRPASLLTAPRVPGCSAAASRRGPWPR
jgi:hypothetical protein